MTIHVCIFMCVYSADVDFLNIPMLIIYIYIFMIYIYIYIIVYIYYIYTYLRTSFSFTYISIYSFIYGERAFIFFMYVGACVSMYYIHARM